MTTPTNDSRSLLAVLLIGFLCSINLVRFQGDTFVGSTIEDDMDHHSTDIIAIFDSTSRPVNQETVIENERNKGNDASDDGGVTSLGDEERPLNFTSTVKIASYLSESVDADDDHDDDSRTDDGVGGDIDETKPDGGQDPGGAAVTDNGRFDSKSTHCPSVPQTSATTCTLQVYHEHFYSTASPNLTNTIPPFEKRCLQALVDCFPQDLTLRLGLLRRLLSGRTIQPNRHVLYYCSTGCGGWGDRMRAAINTFFFALYANASFGIQMEQPVHWDSFFLSESDRTGVGTNPMISPLLYQHGWLDEYLTNETKPTFNLMKLLGTNNVSHAFLNWDSDRPHYEHDDFITRFWPNTTTHVVLSGWTFRFQEFMENPAARNFLEEYRLHDLSRAERTWMFFRLFLSKPAPYLDQAQQEYARRLNDKYVVAVQVRIGGDVMGRGGFAWRDPSRHPLESAACFAQKARELCERRPNGNTTQALPCVVWLTSDSEQAVKMIQEKLLSSSSNNRTDNITVLSSNGELTHIDRTDFVFYPDHRLANVRTFVDWYIMARYSHAFVLSRSGLSQHASWYRLATAEHSYDGETQATPFYPAYQFVKLDEDGQCEFVDFRLTQSRLSMVDYRRRR